LPVSAIDGGVTKRCISFDRNENQKQKSTKMEDRGMTREERGSVKRTIDSLRGKCELLKQSIRELDTSLPRVPEKSNEAGEKWIKLADSIAQQLTSLGEEAAPVLDHWSFEPVDPGPVNEPFRLPELLRTKMREEQEERDSQLKAEMASKGEDNISLSTLQDRQRKANEAIERVLNVLNESQSISAIASKRERVLAKINANSVKKPDTFDGTPLLRLYLRNDRRGIKLDENAVDIDA
jgi:hypothetical protein